MNKNNYIRKPDKGCGVVLLKKADYNKKVYGIINDSEKFEEIHLEEKKLLIKLEDKLNSAFRSLKTKENIIESFYNDSY